MSHNRPMACRHERTEPVTTDVGGGDVIEHGRICTACHERLHTAWGCTTCEWVEVRALCEPEPQMILVRACQEHAATA